MSAVFERRAGVVQARQARVAGPSAARRLDDAEHRCTLADVMAESAPVIVGERALELQCDPRYIAALCARDKQPRERHGDHAHNHDGSGH